MSGQKLAACGASKSPTPSSALHGDLCLASPGSKSIRSAGCYSARSPTAKRKIVCNLGAAPGQLGLISISSGLEPLRPPYSVTVRYDLRPLAGTLTRGETVYLAALDMEKLRRKGSGMGLDVLRASESWIARDCLCSKSGKLKPLSSRDGPGEVQLDIAPSLSGEQEEEEEECVLLRVVAIRQPPDPHDWHALGAAVVLRMESNRKEPGAPPEPQWQRPLRTPRAARRTSLNRDPAEAGPEFSGVKVWQLLDFRKDIRKDLDNYCGAHQICAHPGWHQSRHVCMHEPCPFRPVNLPKYDDHKEVPVVKRANLRPEEQAELVKMNPDMHTVVARYIRPNTNGTGKSQAMVMNPEQPLKVSAFVTHAWTEDFNDFIDTLQIALEPQEVVWVSSFALDQNASVPRGLAIGGPNQCAFAAALQAADKLVVIADRSLSIFSRLWCLFELGAAQEMRVPTFVWPHEQADLALLRQKAEQLDAGQASTSDPKDEHDIFEATRKNFAELEAFNQQLRPFLLKRIECFEDALERASEDQRFSIEKLRRMFAEQERTVFTKEEEHERLQLVRERDQEAEYRELTIEKLQVAHKEEVRSLQQRFAEAELEHMQIRAKQDSDFRAFAEQRRCEIEKLEKLLGEERAKNAQLAEQLSDEKRCSEEGRQRAEVEVMRREELLVLAGEQILRQMELTKEEQQTKRGAMLRASELDRRLQSLQKELRDSQRSNQSSSQASDSRRGSPDMGEESHRPSSQRPSSEKKHGLQFDVKHVDNSDVKSVESAPIKSPSSKSSASGATPGGGHPGLLSHAASHLNVERGGTPTSSVSGLSTSKATSAVTGAATNASKSIMNAASGLAGRFGFTGSKKKKGDEDHD